METNTNLSLLDKFQDWISRSTSLKLVIIGFIILILLIPQALTTDLIIERQIRLEEAENEVTGKWSRSQTVIGPYLALPYHYYREVQSNGENKIIKELKTAYFLPDLLDITGDLHAESLHRGIFDVVVYQSDIQLKADFGSIALEKLDITAEQVLWDQASFLISVSDLRGIGENPELTLNNTPLISEPFTDSQTYLKGLQFPVSFDSASKDFTFSGKIKLKGSKDFHIVPLGKTTELKLTGNWPNPSFQGEFLPEERSLDDDGFQSNWKVLHFNRPFGQEFNGTLPNFHDSAFGLSLKMPVDQYQQSIRTSKYSILIIVLSFLALFLMEIFTKSRVHPLQYILIGFALVLYYTLLIALSEQLGFSLAYLMASLATVGLLALYAKSLFSQLKITGIFTGILSLFYIFIFVIIKQQDYALLIGSIGLFVALAATMFISRKIDWYKS
ncbi:cell envelope integrity protein CreD [Algoriphagus sp. NG3]|uniref:cell envelope integrity protein CreD n=1 Tax=Algoriphagus sp. NG3 TaxID=3097546 RepID=UPI002A820953|nr:cell envelope integrity protein CreD [Algoriphagus sp. NG3]WPR77907.1 cell envelope integrity protein CreD [Algoriphagus sp. NG3]